MIRRIRLLRPSLLRPLLALPSKPPNPTTLSHLRTLSPPHPSPPLPSPLPRLLSTPFIICCRSLSSSPSPPSMVLINSKEGYNKALHKTQDEKVPTIFYFTAAWCGPCKFISPKVDEMNQKFPHVTTYKIDIDQEALGSILDELRICAVPTFHFFQNGKKAAEVVGADLGQIKQTMENLYKLD